MDSLWLTAPLSNDRLLFIEYFLSFVKSVFYTSVFPKRALLLTPGYSSRLLYLDTPIGTTSSFFALRKNSLSFPFVLKWCVFTSTFSLRSLVVDTDGLLSAAHTSHLFLYNFFYFFFFLLPSQPHQKVHLCLYVLWSANNSKGSVIGESLPFIFYISPWSCSLPSTIN